MNPDDVIKTLIQMIVSFGAVVLAFLLGKRGNGENTKSDKNDIKVIVNEDSKDTERRQGHIDILKELQAMSSTLSKEIRFSVEELRKEVKEDVSKLGDNLNTIIINTIKTIERLTTQSELFQAQMAEIFKRVNDLEKSVFLIKAKKSNRDGSSGDES